MLFIEGIAKVEPQLMVYACHATESHREQTIWKPKSNLATYLSGVAMKSVSIRIVVAGLTVSSTLLLGQANAPVVAGQTVASQDSGADQGSMERQIVSKEREGLDALKVGDVERFGNLTADEAVMVDAHGPASKAQVLQNVAGFKLTDYAMEDVRFVPFSANTGLISYKIIEKGVSHGREFAAQAYVSSIWTERGSKWVCLFSQETAARPAPAQ
jgi:hypothetical protein